MAASLSCEVEVCGLAPASLELSPSATGQSHRNQPDMRRKLTVSAETVCAEMASIVRHAVNNQARRGAKMDEAHTVAARHLGMTPRRVRAYLYGEVYSVPAHEALSIVEGGRRAAEAQLTALNAEIAAEREQLERLKSRCEAVSAMFSAAGGSTR